MNRLNILIVVDVEGALAAGTLSNNVYLADTNKYLGSWQEGQRELHTICQNGQYLTWSVASVDPGANIEIHNFGGTAVSSGVCVPSRSTMPGSNPWTGLVETQGEYASFDYSVTLSLNGAQLSFNAFLKVV